MAPRVKVTITMRSVHSRLGSQPKPDLREVLIRTPWPAILIPGGLAILVILAVLAVALSTPSRPSSPSDAYHVGYAEGRFDFHTESKATKKFNDCVAEKKKAPEACWQDQIAWTKVLYRTWDAMTDQQKVDHAAQSNGGIKWADILRGKGDSKVMPPLPVEIP